MGTWGFYKIQSEIEDIIKFGNEEFDNTDYWIFMIKPEVYEEDFRELLLEFGKPINTYDDAVDFLKLLVDKNYETDIIEYNWTLNYTNAKELEEKLKK